MKLGLMVFENGGFCSKVCCKFSVSKVEKRKKIPTTVNPVVDHTPKSSPIGKF